MTDFCKSEYGIGLRPIVGEVSSGRLEGSSGVVEIVKIREGRWVFRVPGRE